MPTHRAPAPARTIFISTRLANRFISIRISRLAPLTRQMTTDLVLFLIHEPQNGWVFIFLRDTKSDFVTFRVISWIVLRGGWKRSTKSHEKAVTTERHCTR